MPMPKIKMRKRQLAKYGILWLSLLLTIGCSAFHEVSVVSHGDEDAGIEEAVSEKGNVTASAPPVVGSAFPQFEQEERKLTLPVLPTTKPVPSTPQVVPPSANGSIGEEIFAQSAEDTTLPWTLQDVFFDYDQMSIRRDAIPILEQNAKVLLKRYAKREVLIQGHCDERGTEAYNFILGERRATAVKNYLINLGVAGSRLRVLSLGKSQPFCLQRTIPCFQQNRRAHFVLK
jgi:outer membrane protein OmpA-like peptidoglycan-associated protein